MSLTIRSITAELVNLGLSKPYSIAYKTVDSVDNVIIRVEAENGLVGYGAAHPSHHVVNEGNEDVMAQLTPENLSVFEGKDLANFYTLINDIHERFSSFGARIGLEIAFHDLFTSYLGVPLVDFYGRRIKELPTSVTIGIMDIDETLGEADDFIGQGFKNLKIKLGKSVDEDIERMHKLVESIPGNVIVRIDANQGWSYEDTVRFHRETSNLSIELIEQPLKQAGVEEMRKFPDELKNLIAADESLISPQDAFDLALHPRACGIYNIKLMKCAGLTKAKEIALIAEKAGN